MRRDDPRLRLAGQTDARIDDAHGDQFVGAHGLQANRTLGRELDGVAHEIQQDLLQASFVGVRTR